MLSQVGNAIDRWVMAPENEKKTNSRIAVVVFGGITLVSAWIVAMVFAFQFMILVGLGVMSAPALPWLVWTFAPDKPKKLSK